ncbi:MFS transporter [Pseudonocardiaceae bacterium YIM PH 21723]|nr:MFS transporter [Pseudonocardiaceae bacterium YIM PH 21723]
MSGPTVACMITRRAAALAVLTVTAFVVVTTELLPVGLLPQISGDLGISDARAGLLVTAYAFTAALTAAPLTALVSRWPRHRVFLAMCGVFVLGTALSGLAVGFPMVAAARLVCGAAHGVFWSIIAGYAAALADPERPGRAAAVVFGGGSTAVVLGVPLGTALGAATGWRNAFLLVSAVALVMLLIAWRVLPDTGSSPTQRVGDLPKVLLLPGLPSLVITTAVLVLGNFTVYTYCTDLLRDSGVADPARVSILLSVYGLAGIGGTWLSGMLVDGRPRAVLFGTVTLLVTAIAVFVFGVRWPLLVLVFFAWGFAFSAVPVSMQTGVLRVSGRSADVASAWYVAAFNLGIGGGALAGGVLLAS